MNIVVKPEKKISLNASLRLVTSIHVLDLQMQDKNAIVKTYKIHAGQTLSGGGSLSRGDP